MQIKNNVTLVDKVDISNGRIYGRIRVQSYAAGGGGIGNLKNAI